MRQSVDDAGHNGERAGMACVDKPVRVAVRSGPATDGLLATLRHLPPRRGVSPARDERRTMRNPWVWVLFGAASLRAEPASPGDVSAELRESGLGVVYESYANDNWDLWIAGSDGSSPRRLTNTPDEHELYPQPSPDGRSVAFVLDRDEDGALVRSVAVMSMPSATTKEPTGRRIVARNARQPCFLRDGRTILYLGGEFEKHTVVDYASRGVFFHDVETGETRPHPNPDLHHLYNPTTSKDGRWIVATVHGGMGYGHAILAIETDGMGVHDLGLSGCRPTLFAEDRIVWGQDDHTIAFGIFDASGATPVVRDRRVVAHHDTDHIYHSDGSPDGRWVVFSRGPGGRMPADGPGTHRGLAEFVGVRAIWNLAVVSLDAGSDQTMTMITRGEITTKEPAWIRLPERAPAEGSER